MRPRAFTVVESVVSILIVGLVLVAALNTLGASRLTQARTTQRLSATLLAADLLREALNPPDAATTPAAGSRQGFDGLGDYVGWSSTPPTDRDGVAIPGADGLTRSVHMNWVSPGSLNTNAGTNTGVVRVEVRVKLGSVVLGEAVGYFTAATLDPDKAPEAYR